MQGLKRILERLGLKQTEFARLLGVSPRTVSLWATGEIALPGPVKAYIRLLQTGGPEVRAGEYARLEQPHPTFEEGLYSVSYTLPHAGRTPHGDAMAVLRSGRIVGSDRWGGRFEGIYRFDTARRTNHVHMRLRVPPDGQLVTGLAAGAEGATVEVSADLAAGGPVATAVVDIAGQPIDLTLAYLGPLPG